MNRLGTIFMLVALILAVLLTNAIYKHQKQTNNSEGISILVATKYLVPGHVLSSSDVRWQPWPKDAIFPHYIIQTRKLDDILGTTVRKSIATGEPIADDILIYKGQLNPLVTILKPGMRAFTIEVDKNASSLGLIVPGDVVDVVLTYNQPDRDNTMRQQYVSQTILNNIIVLGIDQNIAQGTATPKDTNNNQNRSVTLEVTPKQAETLALGKSMGVLSISLSGPMSEDDPISTSHGTYSTDFETNVIKSSSDSHFTQIHGDKIE